MKTPTLTREERAQAAVDIYARVTKGLRYDLGQLPLGWVWGTLTADLILMRLASPPPSFHVVRLAPEVA